MELMTIFYCLKFKTPPPQPEGPGSCIYIHQEQDGPVISPRCWVPFLLPPTAHSKVFKPVPIGGFSFQPHSLSVYTSNADWLENATPDNVSIFTVMEMCFNMLLPGHYCDMSLTSEFLLLGVMSQYYKQCKLGLSGLSGPACLMNAVMVVKHKGFTSNKASICVTFAPNLLLYHVEELSCCNIFSS
jgi:hypothetical protein